MPSFRTTSRIVLLLLLCVQSDGLKFKRPGRTICRSEARSPTTTHRPLSFFELQPHLLLYGATVSIIAPAAWGYQLAKLNPHISVGFGHIAFLSVSLIPIQTMLRMLQLNIGTPISRNLNPWFGFAFMGVIQGGVTGQASVFFSRALNIGNPKLIDALRGFPLAGVKEIIAQGLPFACSDILQRKLLDPLLPSSSPSSFLSSFKRAVSVISTSALGTLVSQAMHNVQFALVANPSLSYAAAARLLWERNGASFLLNGAASRGGLMLLVSALNDLILKRAWRGVEEPRRPAKRATWGISKVLALHPRASARLKCVGHWCAERAPSAA